MYIQAYITEMLREHGVISKDVVHRIFEKSYE